MHHQNNFKKHLAKLLMLNKHDRMLEFVAILTERLSGEGIQPIIVGGLSVEIYTRGNYTTYDIDLIADGRNKIDCILTNEYGFNKEGRSWYHNELELAIEIPDNFLEGSKEKVMEVELDNGKSIYVIGMEDIIIHRLESAIISHPKNPEWSEDYEWAQRIYFIYEDIGLLDINYLLKESKIAKVDFIIQEWKLSNL